MKRTSPYPPLALVKAQGTVFLIGAPSLGDRRGLQKRGERPQSIILGPGGSRLRPQIKGNAERILAAALAPARSGSRVIGSTSKLEPLAAGKRRSFTINKRGNQLWICQTLNPAENFAPPLAAAGSLTAFSIRSVIRRRSGSTILGSSTPPSTSRPSSSIRPAR